MPFERNASDRHKPTYRDEMRSCEQNDLHTHVFHTGDVGLVVFEADINALLADFLPVHFF